jgi:hypothetical protein
MTAWELPTAADDRHTYFAQALALAAVHGPGPWPDGGYPLPDEDQRAFMPGSVQDGVQTHHFSFEVDRSAAASAAAMITAIVEEPLDIIALQALHDFLAEYGTRRNAVAAGIVLIGLTGSVDDRDWAVFELRPPPATSPMLRSPSCPRGG